MYLGLSFERDCVQAIMANCDGEAGSALSYKYDNNAKPASQWLTGMDLCRTLLGRSVVEPHQLLGCGIVVPGLVDSHGVVCEGPQSAGWAHYDLARGLKEHLGLERAVAEGQTAARAWAQFVPRRWK